MKGFITLTHGAWLYLIIALVVILVGIMIVTKGQFLLIFNQEKLKDFFEPGTLRVVDSENVQQGNFRLSENNLDIHCRPGNVYDIALKNINFDYKEGQNVKFYVVLDIGNKLVPATDEYGSPVPISCVDNNCGSNINLAFHARTDAPSEKEFLHFTMWKAEPGVEDIIDLPEGAEDKTLSNLLDSQFRYYLGSFDIGGSVEDACLSVKCKNIDPRGCVDTPGCWRETGWFFGLDDQCRGCTFVSSCSDYKTGSECTSCGSYTRLGCSWNIAESECR